MSESSYYILGVEQNGDTFLVSGDGTARKHNKEGMEIVKPVTKVQAEAVASRLRGNFPEVRYSAVKAVQHVKVEESYGSWAGRRVGAFGYETVSKAVAQAIRDREISVYLCEVVPHFKKFWNIHISNRLCSGTLCAYIAEGFGIRTTPQETNLVRAHIVESLHVESINCMDFPRLEEVIREGVIQLLESRGEE